MRRAILLPALIPAILGAQASSPQSFALPNGMKVLLFEDHSLPLMRGELRLALPPPPQDSEAWLRPLAFRMLEAGGSGTRSAAAFAQATDAIGLDLRMEPEAGAARWTLVARSQDQEAALSLLADRVTRPAFDPLTLEPERGQAWSELAGDALPSAKLRFSRSLAALPVPDDQMLGAVTAHALHAWHRARFAPARATLVLWGDLDLPQARQLAILSFGAWTAQAVPAPAKASGDAQTGPFLAALPGEAPRVSLGLVEDGADAALRRYLRPWAEAQLRASGLTIEDGENGALVLSASAALGTPAEALRARLAAALDGLPSLFTNRDLTDLGTQVSARARLRGLHPAALVAETAEGAQAPADAAMAKAALARWCAPANRRLFASGDPGALQGLQISTPKR